MPSLKKYLRNHQAVFDKLQPYLILYRLGIMRRAQKKGIQKNKAVFSSFDFRSYNDNPRYISEALHALRPEAKIVWLFKDVEKAKKSKLMLIKMLPPD